MILTADETDSAKPPALPALSMQRHRNRSEYWHVAEGNCLVRISENDVKLSCHDTMHIKNTEWHQLSNPYNKLCKIVEIQYGQFCTEDDIERII